MQKLALVLLLASSVLSAKIPLRKKPLTKENVLTFRDRLSRGTANSYIDNGLGSNIPVKDYMNTQYFVDVSIGTPA